MANQNTDCSYGQPEATAFETALALQAMLRYGADVIQTSAAVDYLVATQLPNGSWVDDAYSTALAVRALAEVRPNLSVGVGSVSFTPSNPGEGEDVVIAVTGANTGLKDASNVLLKCTDLSNS